LGIRSRPTRQLLLADDPTPKIAITDEFEVDLQGDGKGREREMTRKERERGRNA
jgi:hypothetical protein